MLANHRIFLLTCLGCSFVLVGCDPEMGFTTIEHRNKLTRRHVLREKSVTKNESIRKKFRLWTDGPNFDTDMPQNVLALQGKTAFLSCRVFDKGNQTISWIRHHDLHILTVGRYTYTTDLRFQSLYDSDREEWILQIKYAQKKDSGRYECQISTQPVRSFFVELKIVEILPSSSGNYRTTMNDESNGNAFKSHNTRSNEAYVDSDQHEVATGKILGDSEVFIDVGSMLNLTCIIENPEARPAFILWYHGDQTIDYSSPRGGISVLTNEHSSRMPASTLLISKVVQRDSGKYLCQPANARQASVMVHIIEGEHHAAIQTNTSPGLTRASSCLLFLLLVLSVQHGKNLWKLLIGNY